MAGTIIRNDIVPYFKKGDFSGGINCGIDAVITAINSAGPDSDTGIKKAVTPSTELGDLNLLKRGT